MKFQTEPILQSSYNIRSYDKNSFNDSFVLISSHLPKLIYSK